MNCNEREGRLNDYVDGLLSEEARPELEQHLERCSNCREELRRLRAFLDDVTELPKSIAPARDLWPNIVARTDHRKYVPKQGWPTLWRQAIAADRLNGKQHTATAVGGFSRNHILGGRRAFVAVALVLAIGSVWFFMKSSTPSWEVARLDGAPIVGSDRITETGRLAVGEWLETDSASRARISVGTIGHVEIEPNTRIRLLKARLTDHRLALARGTMHATIWAPPRLFFVETPSTVAVDLGCAYTLTVDDAGVGILHVTSGYVALENDKGHESIVPAGAFCAMRPAIGPGTPYSENASEVLSNALAKFDFENGGEEAISTVLVEARAADTFTLWHLLFRVSHSERARVYDRMAALIPAPEGVTRDGVLRGDERMLDLWAEKFGLGFSWWRFWSPV